MLAGCTADDSAPETSTSAEAPTGAAQETADPALATACTAFWGDPDYDDPLSREVLDRAGSVSAAGASDPDFFAMTGDDVEDAFRDAPATAGETAAELADWFRTEPERGAEADLDAFAAAWEAVAGTCRDSSAAALWATGEGEPGTKPAALVCADVFDTPGTLTRFANSNVLTSNMFKLVGRTPQQVPDGRTEDLRAVAELLESEIDAVDDEAVRSALEEVRAPFAEALDGDTSSDGLQDPLDQLAGACVASGYDAPAPAGSDGDAVVGAPASRTAPAGPDPILPVPSNGVPA